MTKPVPILILVLAIGCASPDKQGDQPEQRNPLLEARTRALELEGFWMPEPYCQCLDQNRSPFACRSLLNEAFVMELSRGAAGDSLRWSWYGTHEGGMEAMLGYDPATQAFIGEPIGDPLNGWGAVRLAANAGQGSLALWRSDSAAPARFIRIRSEVEAINSRTLAGRYKDVRDSVLVEFTADGGAHGWDTFSRYEVLTDFTFGSENGDAVLLYGPEAPSQGIPYHFHWIGSRLRLEARLAGSDSVEPAEALMLERIE